MNNYREGIVFPEHRENRIEGRLFIDYKNYDDLFSKKEIRKGYLIRVICNKLDCCYEVIEDGLLMKLDPTGEIYNPKDILSKEKASNGWLIEGINMNSKPITLFDRIFQPT